MIIGATLGQSVTNLNFENWETKVQNIEYSAGWSILGIGEMTNIISEKITNDAFEGENSIKLSTLIGEGQNILPSFLLFGGMQISNDFSEIIWQGIPSNITGNSFNFHYKAEFQPGDKGLVYIILKNDGQLIEELTYDIETNATEWTAIEIPINANLEEPDEIFVTFMSSKHGMWGGTPVLGSWLQIDDVHFSNASNEKLYLPNGGFEDWQNLTTEEPVGWESSNLSIGAIRDDIKNVEKTTESYSGEYAALLEGKFMFGEFDSGEIKYRGEFDVMPEKIYFAYKYNSTMNANGEMKISFFKNNGEHLIGLFIYEINPSAVYAIAELEIDINELPEEIEIEFRTPRSPSQLWIDQIWFSCFEPSNVLGEFVSETEVKITWESPYGNNKFEIEWGEKGFEQGTGTIETVTFDNEYTITVPETIDYDIYARSICADDEFSSWSGPALASPGTIGIDNRDLEIFTVYPNPSNGNVYIKSKENALLKIYNMLSEVVYMENIKEGSQLIDINNISDGIYFVVIENENSKSSKKLIIQH